MTPDIQERKLPETIWLNPLNCQWGEKFWAGTVTAERANSIQVPYAPATKVSELERALEIARDALRFYARGRPDIDEQERPGARLEFGCGCCAGVVDAEGMSEYDGSVIGLTAREALKAMGEK